MRPCGREEGETMHRGTLSRVVPALALLALIAAACGGKSTTTKQPTLTNKTTISMKEYAFAVSGTLNPGTASVTVENTGAEFHMAAFGRLKQGTTFADFVTQLQQNQDAAFGLFNPDDPERSPLFLSPGEKSEVISDAFKPGTYALLCFFPAPDGQPHVAKGMVGSLEVKDATPAPFTVKSDGDVTLTEYRIGLPASIKAGKHTFKVTNTGKENHNIDLIRAEPGKTKEDIDTYFSAFDEGKAPTGEPPATIIGSVFSLLPGETAYIVIDLKAGHHFAFCSEETGEGDAAKAHDDLGMEIEFDVT
jgi:uncharacterized cupredoxin-like copper-binding protein